MHLVLVIHAVVACVHYECCWEAWFGFNLFTFTSGLRFTLTLAHINHSWSTSPSTPYSANTNKHHALLISWSDRCFMIGTRDQYSTALLQLVWHQITHTTCIGNYHVTTCWQWAWFVETGQRVHKCCGTLLHCVQEQTEKVCTDRDWRLYYAVHVMSSMRNTHIWDSRWPWTWSDTLDWTDKSHLTAHNRSTCATKQVWSMLRACNVVSREFLLTDHVWQHAKILGACFILQKHLLALLLVSDLLRLIQLTKSTPWNILVTNVRCYATKAALR